MGRTIMLREFNLLMDTCGPETTEQGYKVAILEQNVLLKPTQAARQEAWRRLRQLYGLDHTIIFRILKLLAYTDLAARPLLALLSAIARDITLRSTVDLIITAKQGEALTSIQFQDAIATAFPGQLSSNTLASAGRNTISSWEQSGHLKGLKDKIRQQVSPEPMATIYALFLSYLNGDRGDGLFLSPWCTVLDQPVHVLRSHAERASQQGWLEYRFSGQVTDITFRHFFSEG